MKKVIFLIFSFLLLACSNKPQQAARVMTVKILSPEPFEVNVDNTFHLFVGNTVHILFSRTEEFSYFYVIDGNQRKLFKTTACFRSSHLLVENLDSLYSMGVKPGGVETKRILKDKVDHSGDVEISTFLEESLVIWEAIVIR